MTEAHSHRSFPADVQTSPDHRALTPQAERNLPRLPEPLGVSFLQLKLLKVLSRRAFSRASSSGKPGKHLRFQPPETKRAQERGEGPAGPVVRRGCAGRPAARCPRHLAPTWSPGAKGDRERTPCRAERFHVLIRGYFCSSAPVCWVHLCPRGEWCCPSLQDCISGSFTATN